MLSVATPFHVPPRNYGHSTHMSKFPTTKNMTHSFSNGLITHWALTFYVINSDTMVTARLRCRVHPSLVILSAQQLNTGENIVQSYRIVRLKHTPQNYDHWYFTHTSKGNIYLESLNTV